MFAPLACFPLPGSTAMNACMDKQVKTHLFLPMLDLMPDHQMEAYVSDIASAVLPCVGFALVWCFSAVIKLDPSGYLCCYLLLGPVSTHLGKT